MFTWMQIGRRSVYGFLYCGRHIPPTDKNYPWSSPFSFLPSAFFFFKPSASFHPSLSSSSSPLCLHSSTCLHYLPKWLQSPAQILSLERAWLSCCVATALTNLPRQTVLATSDNECPPPPDKLAAKFLFSLYVGLLYHRGNHQCWQWVLGEMWKSEMVNSWDMQSCSKQIHQFSSYSPQQLLFSLTVKRACMAWTVITWASPDRRLTSSRTPWRRPWRSLSVCLCVWVE